MREVLAGLVGRDLATAFRRHRCPIEPDELLQSGVCELSDRLGQLDRRQLVGLMWGLARLVEERIEDPTACKVRRSTSPRSWRTESPTATSFSPSAGRSRRRTHRSAGHLRRKPPWLPTRSLALAVAKQRPEPAGFVDFLSQRSELHARLADNAWCDNESS